MFIITILIGLINPFNYSESPKIEWQNMPTALYHIFIFPKNVLFIKRGGEAIVTLHPGPLIDQKAFLESIPSAPVFPGEDTAD